MVSSGSQTWTAGEDSVEVRNVDAARTSSPMDGRRSLYLKSAY